MHLFERLEIPAKTTLLREGEIAATVFFIEKGCLRTWFNNDGKDVTTQFFFEGSAVSSIESFVTNSPSMFHIESIEPCLLWCLNKENATKLLNEVPEVAASFQEMVYKRLFHYQKQLLSHLSNNPEQRYKELLSEHPEIVLRVPQHYIASYLGITSVSLSRIRNRF